MCIWTADLPQLMVDHEALLADIDERLGRGERNAAAYGEQTATNLHLDRGAHWKRFFAEMRRLVSSVVDDCEGPIDEGVVHLRAWASRLRRGGDYSERQFRLSAIHNHSPAFLSGVYFLRLPKGVDEADGGTFFINPVTHPLTSPRPGIAIAPAEGRAIMFPSWLMHGPLLLDSSRLSSPRVVIAVDAHFVPK